MGSRLRCRVHITELLSHLVKLRECIKIQHSGSRALHNPILHSETGHVLTFNYCFKMVTEPTHEWFEPFLSSFCWIIPLPNELELEGSRILTRTGSEEAEKDNKRTSGDIIFQIKGRSRRCFQNERHLACPSRHLVGQVSAQLEKHVCLTVLWSKSSSLWGFWRHSRNREVCESEKSRGEVEVNALDFDKITRNVCHRRDSAAVSHYLNIFVSENTYHEKQAQIPRQSFIVVGFANYWVNCLTRDSKSSQWDVYKQNNETKKKNSSLIIPPSVTIPHHDICEAFGLGITYYFFITSLKQLSY